MKMALDMAAHFYTDITYILLKDGISNIRFLL